MESRRLLSSLARPVVRISKPSTTTATATPTAARASPSKRFYTSQASSPFSSTLGPRTHASRSSGPGGRRQAARRTLIAAPGESSGPIMSRRPDRALPDVGWAGRRWLVTMPVFLGVCGASALAIFNYEKSSSSVVAATMYSLRTHPRARALLGDEVYFRDRFPWISGELNQVKGRIDIGYGVKGTAGRGYMRFKAVRPSRNALFTTLDWSLELEDGTIIRLLDDNEGRDPYGQQVQEQEKEKKA